MVRDFKFHVKNKLYEKCDPVQQKVTEKVLNFLIILITVTAITPSLV